jgi:hypothetical protein
VIDSMQLFTCLGRNPDQWQKDVLRSSARQLLLLCSRQAGKSTVAAALALGEVLGTKPALVLLLSPSQRQSAELFRKVMEVFQALGRPCKVTLESVLRLELANGSRILSLPGDEATIRGYSGVSLLVVDEAARVPDELYYAVRPMLAVSGGRMVALSTPFGKRGWFYQEWVSDRGWERVKVTAAECPRIPPAFLADERKAMGSGWYDQEYGCIFTAGGENPLYPSAWLDRAAEIAASLPSRSKGLAMGVDPAEGGDKSAWVIVDKQGVVDLLSLQTPDTTKVVEMTRSLIRNYGIPHERVIFDRGGGGKQHADRLWELGYKVRTVGFGESVVPDPRKQRCLAPWEERLGQREDRYAYRNRRSEMYWLLRELLQPVDGKPGFGIPAEYRNLRAELAPIPLTYDGEGRFDLLPKHKGSKAAADSKIQTLTEIIGHSPDEADALCLAIWGMLRTPVRPKAGAM